jgi:hypothetical protein
MHANNQWVHELVTGPLPDMAQLPVLEEDGKTVRIQSNRDYQRLFEACLCRGVLPVRAEGVKRKERRKLRFRICGLELNIEMKARARSSDGRVAVFVLESFDRHRYLLASLARDVPILV